MKYQWLLVLACVFITACNGAKKDDSKKEEKAKETDKSAQKADKNDENGSEANKQQNEVADNDSEENPADVLAAKFETEQDEFYTLIRKTPQEERKELMEQMPQAETYLPEMIKLAEDNPKTDIAAAAYVWIVSATRDDKELIENAYTQLFENFADSKRMQKVCMGFIRANPTSKVEQRLNTLIENSPHHDVKATATFAKAKFLESVMSTKGSLDDPRMGYLGEESVEYIKASNVETSAIEELYESIVETYPDVKIYGGRKMGKIAAANLFEARNLAIGCTAPDIVGNDLDGKEFKLSDYRGKVVLLDFWGDW